jgi:hypothetical protein
MNVEDPELETFLRQFRPVVPAPRGRRPARRWPWAAVAAVLAALATLPAVVRREHPAAPPLIRPTLGVLRAAMRSGDYDRVLDELDARVLPDPTAEGRALRALADVRSMGRTR